MNLKILAYIGAGLLILALTVGLGIKLISKTEGYKADTQSFYTYDYHPVMGFGCAKFPEVKK